MSVRVEIPEHDGIYFITCTCARWQKIFEITHGYDCVYKWFDYLKSQGHYVLGYVIMPNHFHALLAFRNTAGKSINTIIGNGKCFMAYELVAALKALNQAELLAQLAEWVNPTDRRNGKNHEVFEPSFDWKECYSDAFIEQKLAYMHNNPCSGVWNLVADPCDYLHSSAKFYETGVKGAYMVTSYTALEDVDLTKRE